GPDFADAASGHRGLSGFRQCHPPSGFSVAVVHLQFAGAQRHGKVAVAQLVVQKIVANRVALVAQANHEVAESIRRIDLHDVPENRAPADLHHRLGPELGLLAEPRAQSAGQNYHFHCADALNLFPPEGPLCFGDRTKFSRASAKLPLTSEPAGPGPRGLKENDSWSAIEYPQIKRNVCRRSRSVSARQLPTVTAICRR